MPTRIDELTERDEAKQVYEWRRDEMARAGILPAETLAASGADLHQVLAAKQAGCADSLLLTIFGEL